ncbi:MAG: tetratricopeptide repeat protein, partial [Candidatus Sulfotelmatobacter sp.]
MSKLRTFMWIPALLAMQLVATAGPALGGDVKIPLPHRGGVTPAQKLNRDGVFELKRGHREKAKQLFYRAYLLDPEDPFTLNNLGYMAELDGEADRALRYYALAAKDNTGAVIDRATEPDLRGKPLDAVFQQLKDSDHELNKVNEQAIVMLQQGRVFEAKSVLQSALPRHSQDPFLLNNLGFAMESIGDLDGALRYYSAAASVHSNEPIIVTPRAKWRGRPVSKVAETNAEAISEQIARGEGTEAAAARLNLRGVAALNDNHPSEARKFFMQAYQLD